MKKNTIILYTDDCYDFDEVKKDFAFANDLDFNEVKDNAVWDEINEMLSEDWDEFKDMINKIDAPYGWIISGYNRTWSRSGLACRITEKDIIREIADLGEYFEIKSENGHLYVHATHHDGGCYVELKPITSAGIKVYENWLYYDGEGSEYECLEKMFKCNFFTRLPHIEKLLNFN